MSSTCYSCRILVNLEYSRHIFKKKKKRLKNEFHEHFSSGSRVITCGRTDRQKDLTKLIFAFRNSLNVPKNVVEDQCISPGRY
jgi:hypothetical protein